MIRDFKERIAIQKNQVEIDKNGNHVQTWKDYYSCFAYVNNMSGKEYWEASKVNAEAEIYFIVRYSSEVRKINTKQYRILFRGEQYNITFIDNVQYADKTVKFRAKKVVS